ncbi:M20 family metallopeptidase [Helicovermis profundi]|uniref:ArgE/DapE family deacylase n=1 Tax=Helicovermis profundi TaxID=3065157 RepID=A0AAU9ECU4_9FIRM|nr:ArgE/DapE family deacylase [Clostridia bacterium S502]
MAVDEILIKLLEIDTSIKENANLAIEYANEYLLNNGIESQIIVNNGYKSLVSLIGSGEKTLVLNGHLDVVSASKDQFKPKIIGEKLFARGSADMKSGCFVIMKALIKLNKEKLNSKIMLQLVSDEETGGINCTKNLVEKGYVGDFVICTEPTNLELSIQSKGIIRIDIESFGVSAHGSRPWEGENAILKSYDNFLKIEKLNILNISSTLYKKSSINLAKINGGDIYNRVPDKAVMGLDIRYVPNLDPGEILENINDVIEGKVIVKAVEPGVYVDPKDKNIGELKKSILRFLPDKKIELVGQHGGSDARFFAEKGIPAIEFGPVGEFWHGENEYVDITSLTILEKVICDFARNFYSY